jgi:hypothetical protein
MASFASALDRSMEDIKRPPPAPTGSYQIRVTKMPDTPETFNGNDGTPYERMTFNCQIVAPMDDVDADELAAFGKVEGTPLRLAFIFNTADEQKFEGTLNRMKNFLGHCGIDTSSGTLSEKLAETPNAQFGGTVEHRLDPKDPMITYAEIGRTFAI